MSIFKYIEDEDVHVLSFHELRQLRISMSDSQNPNYPSEKFFEAIKSFLDWYVLYANNILNGKTYPDKLLCECVFREIKTDKQFKENIVKSIFISRDYANYLLGVISPKLVQNFKHAISEFEIDIERLIVYYEIVFKNQEIKKVNFTSWRKPVMTPFDIYHGATRVFCIEESEKIMDLYLRDIKPVVIFQIRQLIEIYFKNVVGYKGISDSSGKPSKRFTMAALDYIVVEAKKKQSRIKLPFEIDQIVQINDWANTFVHTTYLHSSYMQYFALKVMRNLFKAPTEKITTYKGIENPRTHCADIRITSSNSFKDDFEKHLNSRVQGNTVDWMDVKDVHAYILSL